MKISAGHLKGRKINLRKAQKTAKKEHTLRPTSSKVRESIFNIIGALISGSQFADLYAGTGAVGIEAMSRGAKRVFFVEADRKRAEMIKDMLKDCGCIPRANIIKGEASAFITKAVREGLRFNIIFLDPPYHSGALEHILPLLSGGELLHDEGIIIAEHLSKKKLPDEIGKLLQKKAYKYGDTMLTLYRKV
ncbi:MAG: 16S rRNA (guanine(966)-N(2))-methyltransferase RsmD [Nitrospirae bacterium CG02_land_8_20_14_3_00_44_33]|nr:16S rRNA (guanine(966)-N(2))-methyltransferase RsmD [Nitrospirota bacterium]PIV42345.1 MAG: 16S rRNA (guanine(966)-N(2))-methyltransferase RsmD [Nitrospirae bacterium CG02_land_8_20_14_3_00_44_33]PIV66292.1 MAG: 16S rRNA (guanine(966)-N(2))-methyltransferase RsmD [Nitrospirae bacterium CG01_land_8_20_14_3_00_44_22]PIW89813.1 MAG: 16S rRNA (guanine(966)-N(2))-methyltransferase RsmD [Nitrospirae bacterium CG_4_8_14_3_um_filter_44_28]